MSKHTSSLIGRYAIAALLPAVALVLKLVAFPRAQQEEPFLVFFAAVMLSAYLGGLGPGLAATGLAAALSNYFFMRPLYHFGFADPVERTHLYAFVGEAVMASFLCGRLYASRLQIQHTAAETLAVRIAEASEAEKRSIGHDLHDGLGQILTAMSLRCKSLAHHLSRDKSPFTPDAEEISGMARQATMLTRELAHGLAPVELGERALPSALGKLAQQTETLFGVECVLHASTEATSLPPEAALQFYRIAQEAISNAIRHGKANRIQVDLSADGRVKLDIRDNGTGLPEPAERGRGIGLEVMAYRAAMCQAGFGIGRHPQGGTLVSVCWPRHRGKETP